jgi:hypothetical protein
MPGVELVNQYQFKSGPGNKGLAYGRFDARHQLFLTLRAAPKAQKVQQRRSNSRT